MKIQYTRANHNRATPDPRVTEIETVTAYISDRVHDSWEANALGVLVELLADKGLLSAAEIRQIAIHHERDEAGHELKPDDYI